MKKYGLFILTSGLILAILISNVSTLIKDGMALDGLRENVLRLHVLANSDSEYDQMLKLKVRDAVLASGLLKNAESLEDAEETAERRLDDIEILAEITLDEYGCHYPVRACLEDIDFDERVYGDITMPEGRYKALRIEIGNAAGHNWWCVMYPPLCIPCACEVTDDKETEKSYFTEKELDIIHKPQKYRVRFKIWDKIQEIINKKEDKKHDDAVKSDKKNNNA